MNGIVRGAGNRNSYLEGWIMEDGRDRFLLMLFRKVPDDEVIFCLCC